MRGAIQSTQALSQGGIAMTKDEEKYVHFASSMENLSKALQILQKIKENKGNPLAGAAFQFSLIEYSKPYKVSEGTNKHKHKLDDSLVPDRFKALHERILDARDQIHAHADLTVKEAKLYVSLVGNKKYATLIQNKIYGTEEIENIDAISQLIEETLDNMYMKAEKLEQDLAVNSQS